VEVKSIHFPSGLNAGSTSCSSAAARVNWWRADPSGRALQIRHGPERLLEKMICQAAAGADAPSSAPAASAVAQQQAPKTIAHAIGNLWYCIVGTFQ
jgi:hypothetical protein